MMIKKINNTSMELKDYVDQIKLNENYKNNNFKGNFPNPSSIKIKPKQNLNIIVEQAERLIVAIDDPSHYFDHMGIIPSSIDLNTISRLFIHDIMQFATDNFHLNLLKKNALVSQNQIPGYTLFTLSKSRLFPDTYEKYIDLLDQQRAFSLYSIPFLVRLAIESKLKGMIGFKSSTIRLSDGHIKISREFPTLKVINFLISSDLIESPFPFEEIKKIYNWSCGFVHTGEKEYIWMSLKAVGSLNSLFSKDHNSRYHGDTICYLKSGVTLEQFQLEINASSSFSEPSKNKISEEKIALDLSEGEFDMTTGFWDKRKSQKT